MRLHVTDANGAPVAGDLFVGVHPKVEGQGTDIGTGVMLDAEGRGSYDQVLPGAYELRFSQRGVGAATTEITLLPGENSLEVRLLPE